MPGLGARTGKVDYTSIDDPYDNDDATKSTFFWATINDSMNLYGGMLLGMPLSGTMKMMKMQKNLTMKLYQQEWITVLFLV